MKTFFLLLLTLAVTPFAQAASQAEPKPTPAQKLQMERKYGMFLHFGMNTYLNQEWSDGTAPAKTYSPPADLAAKAEEWVKTARRAGMRFILLTTKHHDGFCLWDSQYTQHDIAHPDIKNHIDVVRAVSDACKKHGIELAYYYSLWDRHEPSYKDKDPHKYADYMKNQLTELMSGYGPVCELWLDGQWDRPLEKWYLQEVYDHVKKLQPNCQIGVNWTIGKKPLDMKKGDPIKYFPSDFRLWDPYLPANPDPKIYTWQGKEYYLPFECTQTLSLLGNWFYHENDRKVRELEELEEIFYKSTRNDNCLVIDVPPSPAGNFNPESVKRLYELADTLGLKHGQPFPELKKPLSLTSEATATASSVLNNDERNGGALFAVDGDPCTDWKCGEKTGWLEIDLGTPAEFNRLTFSEGGNNILRFNIEIQKDGQWVKVFEGERLSDPGVQSFMGYGYGECVLPETAKTQKIRINILDSAKNPSLFSVRVLNDKKSK